MLAYYIPTILSSKVNIKKHAYHRTWRRAHSILWRVSLPGESFLILSVPVIERYSCQRESSVPSTYLLCLMFLLRWAVMVAPHCSCRMSERTWTPMRSRSYFLNCSKVAAMGTVYRLWRSTNVPLSVSVLVVIFVIFVTV